MARSRRSDSAYARAGVDIAAQEHGLAEVRKLARGTFGPGVLSEIGSFGGLFRPDLTGLAEPVLVASADGVGTKLAVARLAGDFSTVGRDLVNHCVNDILVQGAVPLFFLDYVGAGVLDPARLVELVRGVATGCRENGCALLGGETAEMPGLYPLGEYDLVGTIVGAVEKKKLITGSGIRAGDVIIGLPSGGLQTNGFSLARKVILDQCGFTPQDFIPGTRMTVADTLLSVHRSFLKPVTALMAKLPIRGMAHITGGGFVDNIPRVLPPTCDAVINRNSWQPPTVFTFIERQGRVDHDEMYRVFNMGIGFVIIVRRKDATAALNVLKAQRQSPVIIGAIEKGRAKVIYRDQ